VILSLLPSFVQLRPISHPPYGLHRLWCRRQSASSLPRDPQQPLPPKHPTFEAHQEDHKSSICEEAKPKQEAAADLQAAKTHSKAAADEEAHHQNHWNTKSEADKKSSSEETHVQKEIADEGLAWVGWAAVHVPNLMRQARRWQALFRWARQRVMLISGSDLVHRL